MTPKEKAKELVKTDVSKSVLLTGKCSQQFEQWFREKRATSKFRFWMLLVETDKIISNSVITEWFDNIGITVDVMPRMADENKIVFEPNTFCLKHEIVTEEFIQFQTRQEAISNAIIQANIIFNMYFV